MNKMSKPMIKFLRNKNYFGLNVLTYDYVYVKSNIFLKDVFVYHNWNVSFIVHYLIP